MVARGESYPLVGAFSNPRDIAYPVEGSCAGRRAARCIVGLAGADSNCQARDSALRARAADDRSCAARARTRRTRRLARQSGSVAHGKRLFAPRPRGFPSGIEGVAQRREFPVRRLPGCGSFHERQYRRRADRSRFARPSGASPFTASLRGHASGKRRAAALRGTRMSARRVLFLDRDGTLNEETSDEQIDSLAKIRLMPGVVPALLELKRAGFAFVMVTNQDGLGTPRFPRESFEAAHRFILDLFHSQGIEFEAVFVCPHFKHEDCACRKPKLGMVRGFLDANDIDKTHSFMIGDRETDLEFAANLGVQGLRVTLGGRAEETWPAIAAFILGRARRALVSRKTKETDISVEVDLSGEGPCVIASGFGPFDHLLAHIDKHRRISLNIHTTSA